MANNRGYHSYHGRTSGKKIALIVVMILLLVVSAGYLLLQDYIIYESDGSITLDLPFFRGSEEGENDDGENIPIEILPGGDEDDPDGGSEPEVEQHMAGETLSAVSLCRGGYTLPADTDTVFGVASMSKSMTCLALCILETEGRLSLKDPVSKYFPKLHIPGTPDELVTLEMIAMHRAGLPPMPPLEWSIAMNSVERDSRWYRHMVATAPNKMDKIEDVIEYISKGDYIPLGMPGEYMSYSNDGYAILSYVVDKASGMSLEEFLDEKVFRPLGMKRTVLDEDCCKARVIAGGNITSLFERDEKGGLLQDDNWSVLPPFRGCACVKSTASDMSRYYQALSDLGAADGKQAIPAEAVELLNCDLLRRARLKVAHDKGNAVEQEPAGDHAVERGQDIAAWDLPELI